MEAIGRTEPTCLRWQMSGPEEGGRAGPGSEVVRAPGGDTGLLLLSLGRRRLQENTPNLHQGFQLQLALHLDGLLRRRSHFVRYHIY